MLKIGPIVLGEEPCIAVALQDQVPAGQITAVTTPRTLLELRLDAFSDPATFRSVAQYYGAHPLLATIRHAAEGGGWRGSEADRLACYRAVMPLVQAVDVEIVAGTIGAEVVAAAREAGCVSIGSYHHFEETPDAQSLEKVHAQGRAMGFDIVKVAARCNSYEDLRRLAEFTLAHRNEHVITVGMGEHGLISRVCFPALGSLITYTFLGAPTAPGQLNCEDTLKYLGVFYPKGA